MVSERQIRAATVETRISTVQTYESWPKNGRELVENRAEKWFPYDSIVDYW
jgi:hypothetical protein